MAVVPNSGSNVFFKKGVPFSNDFKHVRLYQNHSDAYNNLSSYPTVHAMTEVSFVENQGKTYISVDKDIDSLRQVNYIMFQNLEFSQKWFYAFVTKLVRKNFETTHVYFEIDVFQTWYYDITFKQSFVVREHCPLWLQPGNPVVNTIDEGLNYGLEYDDVYVKHFVPNSGVKWMVIIAKELMHGTNAKKSEATYTGIAQPFTYYVLPFMINGDPVTLKDGDDSHAFASPEKLLTELYKTEGATNNIVSIFMTESIGCPIITRGGGETPVNIEFTEKDQKFEYTAIGEVGANIYCLYVQDVKRFKTETFTIGDRYEGLPDYTESKLLMYPYTILTLDDFNGNRTDYRLEYINQSAINLNLKGSIGTSNNVTYTIQDYNNRTESTNHLDNQYGLININPNDIPVITELISAYLQGNKNSIQNQRDTIMWNGATGLAQNAVGVMGSGASVTGGNIVGGVGGAISSGVSAIKGTGNTVLQLQGIEAKLDDIRNVPPQLNKMGSNNSYAMGHRYDGVTLIKKTIKPEYRKKLEDFFKAYGYKKNELKIPNFHTRENWNYVETKSCNIVGDLNSEDLNELKSIFDNGVTLWHTNNVGDYSLSNGVI